MNLEYQLYLNVNAQLCRERERERELTFPIN